MKTERRHTLQTNWLADHLGQWLKKIKPYTNHIITGACVLAAVVVVWVLVARWWGDEDELWRLRAEKVSGISLNREWASDTAGTQKQLQEAFDAHNKLMQSPPINNDAEAQQEHQRRIREANDKIAALRTELQNRQTVIRERRHDELRELAKKNIRTKAGQAAAFEAAGRDFAEGADSLLSDPIRAREKLDQAAELLELVKKHAQDKLLRHRAQFELARVYETRLRRDRQRESDDDVSKAIAEYEALVKEDSYCKQEAEERLAMLKKSQVFDWVRTEVEENIERSGTSIKTPGEGGPGSE